jgi:hypothetical protein
MYMLPPVETNFDLVVQNNVTSSVNLNSNLGQKELRYLNLHTEIATCSNIGLRLAINFIGTFSGSYNELRDKPIFRALDYYKTLSCFPDNTLASTTTSSNLISGLALEAPGAQLSYFKAGRIVATDMPVLNEAINNIAIPELFHQAANKRYVENRFIA